MMKKRKFGSGGMPSMKESMESGNRVSRQVGAETKKLMPATRSTRPSVGDAIASGNRMSKKNAEDLKAVKKYAKGGKVKRYAAGDLAMSDAAIDLEAAARGGENLRELDRMDFSIPKVEAPAKKESFSAAFAAARKRGDKTFTWNGGSYGTKMKGEDDKSLKPRDTRRDTPRDTPINPAANKPSDALNTRARQIMKERENSFTRGPLTMAEALKEAAKTRVPAPSVTRGYADRGARTLADRKERAAKNAATEAARPKKPNIFTRMYDMTVNPGVDKKYAKGGVTRADGCAVRGKTKGKMV